MNNKPVSLKEFKNWLADQKDLGSFFSINRDTDEDPNEKYIGSVCKSKVGEQKLLEKIETEDDPETVIREFLEEGGSVIMMEGKKVQIEVESGTFTVPRFCIKIRKEQ